MKNLILHLLLSLLLSFSLPSCDTFDNDLIEQTTSTAPIITDHAISYSKALEIANRKIMHFSNSNVRSHEDVTPDCEYVINTIRTRSTINLPDTLAYIFNYPDNGGFVIVAGDDRVNPIIGYSETNSFSTTVDITRELIVNNIPSYLEDKIRESDGNAYEDDDSYWDTCYGIGPMGNFGLTQFAPYDTYIGKEYPDYPIGCVTVAVGMILSETKKSLFYHDHQYYPNAIRKALKKHYLGIQYVPNEYLKIFGGDYEPTYTYEQAVDEMSLLLYWISKDLEIKYSIDKFGNKCGIGDYRKIEPFLKSVGCTVPIPMTACNLDDMLYYFTNSYVMIMRGVEEGGMGNHDWVCDGCQYCYDINDKSKYVNVQLHCDWGWGGLDNGYYPADIIVKYGYKIDVDGLRFASLQYLPVLIETGDKS